MDVARGPAMKSVSIMWAEGVTDDEARVAVGTVRDLIKVVYDISLKAGVPLRPTAIRPFGTWVIPSLPAGDPYSGTHWYIDTAFDRRIGKLVAPRFLELVKQEPWQQQNPHFDVAIVDRDLTDGGASDSVLASVLPGVATVISVHRLREVRDEERRRGLRRLVVHNFGHILDVPAPGRSVAVEGFGRERHCTNVCAMRDAHSVDELLRLAAEEDEVGVLLCSECRQDVLRSVLLQRVSAN